MAVVPSDDGRVEWLIRCGITASIIFHCGARFEAGLCDAYTHIFIARDLLQFACPLNALQHPIIKTSTRKLSGHKSDRRSGDRLSLPAQMDHAFLTMSLPLTLSANILHSDSN